MKINGNDIRLNEPYETRDGREVFITKTDYSPLYPFAGHDELGDNYTWSHQGKERTTVEFTRHDIINLDKYNEPMKAETRPHKHADLIAKLAEMLKTDHEAWNRVQFYSELENEWRTFTSFPSFLENKQYRFAPETVTINGMECPKAVREPLKEGQHFFTPELYDSEMHNQYRWRGCDADRKWMRLGLIYLTKEDAITVAGALLKKLQPN